MKLFFAFSVTVVLLAGCSTQIVKQDELAKVHKVAIIGVDLQQQKSVSAGDLVGAALKTSGPSKAAPALRVDSDHVEGVYSELAHKIAKDTGWQVMSLSEVRGNSAYKELFKKKTEGFQNRPMINDRYVVFAPPGILDSFAVQTTRKEALVALAKALRVDAVIYADSVVDLNNNSVFASMVGKGEFHPSSNSYIMILDGEAATKIYMSSARGPKVETAERNVMGMANEDRLNTLAQTATATSFDLALKNLSVKR